MSISKRAMILNKETIPEGEDADEYAGQFYLERKS
jgi:hypothetical protein